MTQAEDELCERLNHRYYTGYRALDAELGDVVVSWHERGAHGDLPPCLDIVNHSPSGYEWGYGGSGPAQLAYALCYDILRDKDRAFDCYQTVKRELVAELARHRWILTAGEIYDLIVTIEGKD